jgi:hypothetical protein
VLWWGGGGGAPQGAFPEDDFAGDGDDAGFGVAVRLGGLSAPSSSSAHPRGELYDQQQEAERGSLLAACCVLRAAFNASDSAARSCQLCHLVG